MFGLIIRLGSIVIIPPPTPPLGGNPQVWLGDSVGGDAVSTTNTYLGIEIYQQ